MNEILGLLFQVFDVSYPIQDSSSTSVITTFLFQHIAAITEFGILLVTLLTIECSEEVITVFNKEVWSSSWVYLHGSMHKLNYFQMPFSNHSTCRRQRFEGNTRKAAVHMPGQ